ncbi:MAG: polysaccharide biosynthesis/export family protein [Gammaproteobacteria bacterium]|nr:polysaccharide biosynthesis/export family protein [Gammaproteobacteria bacterium]MCW9005918.1 polysaccharide biosynthesis/export family protein [Gammaproteobacteria bacterium]MCW9055066.1 polysaccharide biosynthesis/export family protein [Gammaproteobacteria bacterium]
MIKRKLTVLVTAIIVMIVAGCASDIYIETDSEVFRNQDTLKTVDTYRIGVDDTVVINVWKNPELSVTVPVRPDGKVSMPLIGDVPAAGYTPEEVSIIIKKRLQNYVRDPNVTLIISDLQSHEYLTRVRVTGAVQNQSSMNYRQGMTVLDAVLGAGGVNDYAAPDKTKLYRKISGKTRVISIYLGDILYKGRLSTNIELRPGDIITVPERIF